MPVKQIRAKRLYEQIADEIVRLMKEGEFDVGQRLPSEQELARRLGVSRPSVREAMIALETAGLIDVRTGDGTYVRHLPTASLRMPWARGEDPGPGPLEQFEARVLLETELAVAAAPIIDEADIDELEHLVDRMERRIERDQSPALEHEAFHVKLAEGGGNTVLARFVRELWDMRREPMWDTIRNKTELPENLMEGVSTRRALIACLRGRDGRRAREVMGKHFANVRRRYFGH